MQYKYLKHDLYRYLYPNDSISRVSILTIIREVIFTQGIWALCVYRFRRWVTYECTNRLLQRVLRPMGHLMHLWIEVTTGIHIRPEIDIGPGFYIGHFGGIFLGDKARIGKMCNIGQGCTVGYAGRGEKRGLPEIGDFVHIAAGAKILGKIKVGNFVSIGANAVVTNDVPENAVVGGVPARIISYGSSRDFIHFNREKHRDIL